MSLTIDERLDSGCLVLGMTGDLDIYTAAALRSGLAEALQAAQQHEGAPRGLVVDLSTVSFMDSAGLGVLIGAYQRAAADHTPLRFAGATTQVTKLLEITGLSRVFSLHPSVSLACGTTVGS